MLKLFFLNLVFYKIGKILLFSPAVNMYFNKFRNYKILYSMLIVILYTIHLIFVIAVII